MRLVDQRSHPLPSQVEYVEPRQTGLLQLVAQRRVGVEWIGIVLRQSIYCGKSGGIPIQSYGRYRPLSRTGKAGYGEGAYYFDLSIGVAQNDFRQ